MTSSTVQAHATSTTPDAAALHATCLVIDASAVVESSDDHFRRFRAGGVSAVNHTVAHPDLGLTESLAQISAFRRWLDHNPEHVLLCRTTADIHLAKAEEREAVILGPQDTLFMGTDLSMVGTVHDLGIRVLQLTYQKRNWIGDGCGEPSPAGLSSFGRHFIREMDELGIVVDLSHCSRPTTLDAVEASRHPVVLTHAHPSAVTPHLRAKDDDVLRAIADSGGVVGVTGLSPFNKTTFGVRPGLPEVLRHIDYLVDLIGIDHVGIGLDFDETNTPERHAAALAKNPELEPVPEFAWEQRRVTDLTNAADVGNLTAALVAAGTSEGDVRKLLGLNFLRVFDQVWQA